MTQHVTVAETEKIEQGFRPERWHWEKTHNNTHRHPRHQRRSTALSLETHSCHPTCTGFLSDRSIPDFVVVSFVLRQSVWSTDHCDFRLCAANQPSHHSRTPYKYQISRGYRNTCTDRPTVLNLSRFFFPTSNLSPFFLHCRLPSKNWPAHVPSSSVTAAYRPAVGLL